MIRRAVAALLAAALVALAGCSVDRRDPADGGTAPSGDITVFAAASLTEVFNRIGAEFETAHPGTAVVLSFGGSSGLAQQIVRGAPADVFAAAAPEPPRQVVEAGLAAGEPRIFARNQLVIAVPADNPAGVRSLADLARPGVTVALCAPQVPCGAAAGRALAAAGVRVEPVTQEQDVKAALTKVRLGEVDAALVYRTDVAAAQREVTGIEFPESAQAVNDCPALVLADAPNRTGADAFLAYLTSAPARAMLAEAGFQTP